MSSYHYLKDTHGSASIIGKAVSWIFDGRLKPIPYTPWSSCGLLYREEKLNKCQDCEAPVIISLCKLTVVKMGINETPQLEMHRFTSQGLESARTSDRLISLLFDWLWASLFHAARTVVHDTHGTCYGVSVEVSEDKVLWSKVWAKTFLKTGLQLKLSSSQSTSSLLWAKDQRS